MRVHQLLFAAAVTTLVIFGKCAGDAPKVDTATVNIQIDADPDRLTPILTTSAPTLQVTGRVFLALAEIDPADVVLKPLLIRTMPTETVLPDGTFRYDFEFLEAAKWDNGQPVTGHDFVFTTKATLVPGVATAAWKGYQEFISDIQVDAKNSRKVAVFASKKYLLAVETITGVPILPAYSYDPSGLLAAISVADLIDPKKAEAFAATDGAKKFIADFQSPARTKEAAGAIGCGPYRIDEIVAGQRVVLSKKANWWGDAASATNPLLRALPQKIVYKPIADRQSAITMLKEGGVDVMKNIPPAQFLELRKDAAAGERLAFFTPDLMQYSYVVFNVRKGPLADRRVRRALAHCLDLDAGVQTIMQGFGKRAVGPINPSKPYFDSSLEPLKIDLEKAKSLLKEAGWADSDKNGTLDKGKNQPLKLRFSASPKSEVGKATALQLQENAKKVGIEIEIVQKEMNAIMEDFKSRDFDMTAFVASQTPFVDDLHQTWHTENDAPGGGNRSGFGSAASDKIIDELRTTTDLARRNELFKSIQRLIYDEQPFIFLFVPQERIAISKKFRPVISNYRPGFFEQYFEAAK